MHYARIQATGKETESKIYSIERSGLAVATSRSLRSQYRPFSFDFILPYRLIHKYLRVFNNKESSYPPASQHDSTSGNRACHSTKPSANSPPQVSHQLRRSCRIGRLAVMAQILLHAMRGANFSAN
ncbi:hypothetical protein M422DRAFT_32149 [Sphaerobolus stellatus SS14]|uniref:Uncharacterized protein n=1 Tax=Sphaerobolus stellatus (strain SS14) TaxID=990650 RepID=A0A0C9VH20_SPHS4|nr:hypothetical protein M422DRAFT_32149 [Sphaerobolus stellatus SS14]